MASLKIKVLALVVLLLLVPFVRAAENVYDVVAKALTPFTALLAQRTEGLKKAVHARILINAAEQPDGAVPVALDAEIWLETPDKLKVRTLYIDQPITIWRDGQKLFAAPGGRIRALLEDRNRVQPPNPNARLQPFALPIPDRQLPLLPAMLQVIDDREAQDKAGVPLRVVDLQMMPEIARNLGIEGFRAEATINTTDYKLRRLRLTGSPYNGQIIFQSLDFSRNLPPEIFRPDPLADEDIVEISPAEFNQLLQRR
ncbi:MAG TPA: hypothetical protein VIT21_06590 [Chthoniobacterales bacterium]